MHVAAAQILGGHNLARRRLHEGWAAQEDRSLVPDDDGLVRHRRHIGATCGARPHDRGNLRYACGRHGRLIVEDPTEMLPVGKDLVLARQMGAAGVDEVDAGQSALAGDLLRAQMLLHRDREVGTTLHRGVVGDDHACATGYPADPGDDPGCWNLAVIHALGGELGELEKWRSGIDQPLDALARQELAPCKMALPGPGIATLGHASYPPAEIVYQTAHTLSVGSESLLTWDRPRCGLRSSAAPHSRPGAGAPVRPLARRDDAHAAWPWKRWWARQGSNL